MKDYETQSCLPSSPVVLLQNRLLGNGVFARVYVGQWNNTEVAIKVPVANRAADRERTRQEIGHWRKLHHANICQFLFDYIPADGSGINIVSELMDGDLGSKVFRSKDEISFLQRLHWARDSLAGLGHLHANNILHRDFKLVNVLISNAKQPGGFSVGKLTDFGMSQALPAEGFVLDARSKPLGTPLYMAPEALMGGRIASKVDIYSYGICLWEIMSLTEAFAHFKEYRSFVRAIAAGERPPLDPSWPQPLQDLMERCWEAQPAKRPTAQEGLCILDQLIESMSMAVETNTLVNAASLSETLESLATISNHTNNRSASTSISTCCSPAGNRTASPMVQNNMTINTNNVNACCPQQQQLQLAPSATVMCPVPRTNISNVCAQLEAFALREPMSPNRNACE